jgi:hypothetical protein
MSALSRDEFLSFITLLQKSVDDGFEGVHRRQDTTNGRLGKAEDRIRVVEQNVAVLTAPVPAPASTKPTISLNDIKTKLVTAAAIGAGIVGAVIKLIEAFK